MGPRPEQAARRGVSGRGPLGVLVAALALASLLLAYEYQRAGELGDRVEALQGALDSARDELGVHRERMALVRSHVDDLSARVGALAGLVADAAPQSPDGGASSD